MNPEADRLRRAMEYVDGIDSTEHQWLNDNADTVAELVDAAMDAVNTGRIEGVEGGELNRLARAVVDFKGPQEPPEPERREHTVLYCPEPGCTWWRAADVGPVEVAYRIHYREMHQGGKPRREHDE